MKIHDISDPSNPDEIGHWQNAEQTSFWTAEAAADGFVATSADVSKILTRSRPPAVREGLYVFPDAPERGTADGSAENSDGSGPGFGVPAAVGGALGGYCLRRWREND